METIKRLGLAVLCALTPLFIASGVLADTEGGNYSGGGQNVGDCKDGTFVSTSCGAEWRYYTWGESAPGISYNGNSVTINGWQGQMYARGYTLTNCDEGGFWRYAFVSNFDGNIDGYHKGDQVGLLGIGGGASEFLAQKFGGPVVNRNDSSWDRAQKVYESYHNSDPDNYPRGWDAESDLFVFCGRYDPIEKKVLQGIAINYDGTDLNLGIVRTEVQKGSKATITRQNTPKGYTYYGWRKERKGELSVVNNDYTVQTLNDDETVYSVYEKNLFEGKATSSSNDKTRTATTGWTSNDKTAETIYIDCPANLVNSRCSAKIQFEIRRTKGSGPTNYTLYDYDGNELSGYNNVKTGKDGGMNVTLDVFLNVGDKKCYSMKARASEADDKWFTVKACVAAPYNFNNSTEVTIADDEIIFAGEQKEITYNVTKGKRNNATVGKEYSTISPNTIHGLQVSYDGGNSWQPGYEHPTAETFSEENNGRSGTITFWDVDAGTNVCIRSYVIPANSGSDTNLDVTKFNGTAYSPDKAKCFFVAKRPNMQVLGGSYYSGKKTETSTAIKYIDGAAKVFGSWGEQSVIGVGTINGFASGSANSLTLGNNTGFCQYRTLLTFNNIPCNGNSTEKGIGVATANDNRDALVDYWVADSIKGTDNGEVYVNDDRNIVQTIAGKNVQYTNTQDEIRVNGGALAKGTTRIIKTSRNATIVGNIVYEDGYGGAADIPKMIISADTITISCNVDRIDAILIAKNSINTCNDHISYGDKETGPANAAEQNRQLLVRGMVIANKLIPSRTYGAGKGADSGAPAETINYDSSTMLWAQYMAGNDDSGALTVTYQRELAPRY